jgi:hypothetical protein
MRAHIYACQLVGGGGRTHACAVTREGSGFSVGGGSSLLHTHTHCAITLKETRWIKTGVRLLLVVPVGDGRHGQIHLRLFLHLRTHPLHRSADRPSARTGVDKTLHGAGFRLDVPWLFQTPLKP